MLFLYLICCKSFTWAKLKMMHMTDLYFLMLAVRLQGPGSQFSVEKFTGFLLVAEPTDGLSPESSAGNFQLTKSDSFARFSEYCPHAVKHASEVPKSEVQVQWIAPAVATGCVSFRCEPESRLLESTIEFIYCPDPGIGSRPKLPINCHLHKPNLSLVLL